MKTETNVIKLELDNDIAITIEYVYHPEEPVVMYYKDGSGHPGCGSEVEIEKIFAPDGEDVTDLLDSIMDVADFFNDKLIEAHESKNEIC